MKLKSELWIISEKIDDFNELSDILSGTYNTYCFSSSSEALPILSVRQPEIALIDFSSDKSVGLEFCHVVKTISNFKKIKLIGISDSLDFTTELRAFNNGIDDFVFKPFHPESFFKRIQVRLEKKATKSIIVNTKATDKTSSGKLHIDRDSFSVYLNNENISVSRKEFELLHLMASNPGKVFTREEIVDQVWKRKINGRDRTIDVHILRLRKKLGNNFISTQKGVGYRFINPS